MPFQVGSENFELSFQGKSLRLAVVPVAGMGTSGPAGWEPRGCGFRVLFARPAVGGGGRGSQGPSEDPCSSLGSDI